MDPRLATIEKLAQMVSTKVGERSLITVLKLHSMGTYHKDIAFITDFIVFR